MTIAATPTNVIMGFLGAGKTTAILDLLDRKPAEQKWAVLVNEFGRVGIDGAIYASKNAAVKELPGGCLCCTLGLPFEVAVNRLLNDVKPDRLLIEPTGLGHPKRLLDKLTGGYFRPVLDVKASLCLVDPRRLSEVRYTDNENFVDQIAMADVLIANKSDLADQESLALFRQWAERSRPRKALSAVTSQGRLAVEWLDLPRQSARLALFPEAHAAAPLAAVNTPTALPANEDYHSAGEVFPEGSRFDFDRLCAVLAAHHVARVKGIVDTDRGWFLVNGVDGRLDYLPINPSHDSRIECLGRSEQAENLLQAVHCCLNRSGNSRDSAV